MTTMRAERSDKKDGKDLSYAELGSEIGAVEQRLHRRWASTRLHAAAVNQDVRQVLSSPWALVGAVGLGFGVAWFFPRAKPEPADVPYDSGATATSSIVSALNLAGMVMSMFPAFGSGSGAADPSEDPR
jgi:hypothetical protein